MVVADETEWRRLPGVIAVYRAAIAQGRGEVSDATRYAQRALELASPDDDLIRGSAAGILGLAAWTSGDLETGHRMYAECMRSILRIGYRSDALGCSIALADIRIAQGRLSDAKCTYEEALELTGAHGEPLLRGTADMYVGMSEVYRERNDLQAATQLLRRSKELGEFGGLRQNPYRWCVAMALLREAEGDLDDAANLLNEAERLYHGDLFPNVRPIAALKARIWLAQGQIDQALRWAEGQGLSAEDDLSYLHELEHITLARVLLAQYRSERADRSIHDALRLLDRLLLAAEQGGRTGSAIQVLVVLALAHAARGDTPAALVSLERALTFARPEGYVRMFVDEGPPMADLLREAATRQVVPAYVGELLAAFQSQDPMSPVPSRAPKRPALQSVSEQLSQRELDVLRLFNSELSGPEIARELVVALSTVRTHTKSIYGKLGVTSRHAAVKRAGEMGLI
jgi:LuxR family maltose regulon positive regulatory protein